MLTIQPGCTEVLARDKHGRFQVNLLNPGLELLKRNGTAVVNVNVFVQCMNLYSGIISTRSPRSLGSSS